MKNSGSIFEFAIPENPIVHENFDSIIEFGDSLDSTIHPPKVLNILYRTEVCTILANFA